MVQTVKNIQKHIEGKKKYGHCCFLKRYGLLTTITQDAKKQLILNLVF